jgi:sialic acid synthase SpsE/D-lyxose ketol-isomerase
VNSSGEGNRQIFGNVGNPILILELANNHNGSVEHGKKIIDRAADAIEGLGFDAAIKFQYRDLDNLIHSNFKGDYSYKYIKRFEETRLTDSQFFELIDHSRSKGFSVACTPFDEASVDKVVKHGFDYLKVASAYSTDWPLLTRVVDAGLPTIVSTGGLSVRDLDRSVVFLSKRIQDLALMHCVAVYPTPDDQLALNRIDLMRERFPGIALGYSTHERQDNYQAVGLALAKGAHIFERHIAEDDGTIPVNAYSSSSDHLRRWAESLRDAVSMTSGMDHSTWVNEVEQSAVRELRRGVYASRVISAGTELSDPDVFFAIPVLENQVTANDWSKLESKTATSAIEENQALQSSNVELTHVSDAVRDIIEQTRELLKKANVILPAQSRVELSHHYGLDRFFEFGAVLATLVNRDYCKKIIAVFPGQSNPEHMHKIKEETFICVYGEMTVNLGGEIHRMKEGDILTVPTGVPHGFTSAGGAVFEEISSTHQGSDSYYTDESINSNSSRKTELSVWSLVK